MKTLSEFRLWRITAFFSTLKAELKFKWNTSSQNFLPTVIFLLFLPPVKTNGQNCPDCCESMAEFTYTIDEITCEVCFIPQYSGENFIHTWIFGDGNISQETNPCHTYQLIDPLVCVSLIVVDNSTGIGYSCFKEIDLEQCGFNECHPLADFIFEVEGCEVEFIANEDPVGSTHFWDFGDGNTSTEFNDFHV